MIKTASNFARGNVIGNLVMSYTFPATNLLPASVKAMMRNTWQGLALSRTEKVSFDAKNLLAASELKIESILADAQVAKQFAEDHAAIAAVLGTTGEMHAGVNPGDRKALYHLVACLKPQHVLEIGTHIGMSTVYIAGALRSFGSSTAHMVTGDIVDVNKADGPWAHLHLPSNPATTLTSLGLGSRVTFEHAPANSVLANTERKFDLIFLDGDHSSAAVYQEIALALGALNPNGVIVLHDYYPIDRPFNWDGPIIRGPWAGVARATRESHSITVLPLGDLPWPTKQGSHFTSLALVLQNR